jgi:hypothetical protein
MIPPAGHGGVTSTTLAAGHTLISDWYGTSREFAADFMESSKC